MPKTNTGCSPVDSRIPCTSACRQGRLANAGHAQGSCEEIFASPSVLPNGNPTGTANVLEQKESEPTSPYRAAEPPFLQVTTKLNFHVAESHLIAGI